MSAEVTNRQIRTWYADLNGAEAASVENLKPEIVEATAEYLRLNAYDQDDFEIVRIALGALDVLRLAFDGQFVGLGRI